MCWFSAILISSRIKKSYCEEVVRMAEKLKKIECDPKCGFLVRSHDEKEIIEIATQHAKKSHNMAITEKDVKGMLKDA
jgi:predicted small metal-binding protein